jgi:hypothetical protein
MATRTEPAAKRAFTLAKREVAGEAVWSESNATMRARPACAPNPLPQEPEDFRRSEILSGLREAPKTEDRPTSAPRPLQQELDDATTCMALRGLERSRREGRGRLARRDRCNRSLTTQPHASLFKRVGAKRQNNQIARSRWRNPSVK